MRKIDLTCTHDLSLKMKRGYNSLSSRGDSSYSSGSSDWFFRKAKDREGFNESWKETYSWLLPRKSCWAAM